MAATLHKPPSTFQNNCAGRVAFACMPSELPACPSAWWHNIHVSTELEKFKREDKMKKVAWQKSRLYYTCPLSTARKRAD